MVIENKLTSRSLSHCLLCPFTGKIILSGVTGGAVQQRKVTTLLFDLLTFSSFVWAFGFSCHFWNYFLNGGYYVDTCFSRSLFHPTNF